MRFFVLVAFLAIIAQAYVESSETSLKDSHQSAETATVDSSQSDETVSVDPSQPVEASADLSQPAETAPVDPSLPVDADPPQPTQESVDHSQTAEASTDPSPPFESTSANPALPAESSVDPPQPKETSVDSSQPEEATSVDHSLPAEATSEEPSQPTENLSKETPDSEKPKDSSEHSPEHYNLQKILGITDAELQERQAVLSEIKKLEIWEMLSVVQQERLRQAVILDYEPPMTLVPITSFDQMLKPEKARMLSVLPIRNRFMNSLPRTIFEESLKIISRREEFQNLSEEAKKELSRRILRGRNIPEGYQTWLLAINDGYIDNWIRHSMDDLNKPTSDEPSDDLQYLLGMSDGMLKEVMEPLKHVEKMDFFLALTPVEQERLRQAIILDKPAPKLIEFLGSVFGRPNISTKLAKDWPPFILHGVISNLPRVSHEDVLKKATSQSWWKSLSTKERNKVSKLILLEQNAPEDFGSWKAAVDDPKLGDWVQENKAEMLKELIADANKVDV